MLDKTIGIVIQVGSSMWPSIKNGDRLLVLPCAKYLPKANDIVIINSAIFREKLVCHRIIRAEADYCITRGDNNALPDNVRLSSAEIMGIVIAVYRANKWRKVSGKWSGMIGITCYKTFMALGKRCRRIYRNLCNVLTGVLDRRAFQPIRPVFDHHSHVPPILGFKCWTILEARNLADLKSVSNNAFKLSGETIISTSGVPGQSDRGGGTPTPDSLSSASSIYDIEVNQDEQRNSWLARWLKELMPFRLVEFARPRGSETHLFFGKIAIGKSMAGATRAKEWRIRFPYRLLVNPESLPGQMETKNINREGAKDAKRTATRKILRIT